MLSICIPIYNYNVTDLVKALAKQVATLSVPCEIVCVDDCSVPGYHNVNRTECSKVGQYIQLDANIGRARIRNLFLTYARYGYLLFLDCDSKIISDTFLADYVDALLKNKEPVICGGRIYSKEKPSRNKRLRWKYGLQKESKEVTERLQQPNRSFMTNNFIIHRAVLSQCLFDERLVTYGHEDTLFGFRLKKAGFTIDHLDNPVLNDDLETNHEFLKKTEMGLKNLVLILGYVDWDASFVQDVAILQFYKKCKDTGLLNLIYVMYFISKPFAKFLLERGFVILSLFDFYKLGFLIQQLRKKDFRAIQSE
jgi:glycosyltransferase involved in cell wall biosynthesis